MANFRLDKDKLKEICDRSGVEFLGLFGSVARGDGREDSDVDVLVRFSNRGIKGLLAFVRMERELSRVFGRKVDLVTEDFLSPYFRDEVKSEVKPLYGQA